MTLNSSLLSEVDKPFSSYIFTGNSPTQLEVQAKLFASKILFGSDTYSYALEAGINLIDKQETYDK